MLKNMPYALILMFILVACGSDTSPAQPQQAVQLGEQLLVEDFDAVGAWDTYEDDGLYLNVEDGVYRGMLNWRGRFIWGVNNAVHNDALIEVDLQFDAADRLTMGGIMCRTSPQNSGDGYYFLIAANGRFSIRRGTTNSSDELVKWQPHPAIHPAGQVNRLRAVCVGNQLQFFVNETYLASAVDESYHRGYTGLVMGMPQNTAQAGHVTFDNLRVWEASMP
jgi:hypothetical protein